MGAIGTEAGWTLPVQTILSTYQAYRGMFFREKCDVIKLIGNYRITVSFFYSYLSAIDFYMKDLPNFQQRSFTYRLPQCVLDFKCPQWIRKEYLKPFRRIFLDVLRSRGSVAGLQRQTSEPPDDVRTVRRRFGRRFLRKEYGRTLLRTHGSL